MSKVYFGGVPTEGDVRLLIDHFGQPKPEDEITHDAIEEVLRMSRDSSRYRSVTLAWRKHMERNHNLRLAALSGVGFRCQTDSERVASGVSGVQSGLKKQMRSILIADRVQTDDETLRSKQDLLRRYGVAIRAEATKVMREIEPTKPAEQASRIALVKNA